MRGWGRLSAVFSTALVATACLELSEVEESDQPDSSLPDAGTGGIAGDAWHAEEESGGSAGQDATQSESFPARGVVFDGVDDWLELIGAFSDVTDSQVVSGSVWFKRRGVGVEYCLGPEAEGAGDHNQMEWLATNEFSVSWRRAGGGLACALRTQTPITDTTSWHHIAFSVDVTDVTKTRLYLDGALDLGAHSVSGYDLDNTGSKWGLFAQSNAIDKYDGEVAELWLALDRWVDFSNPAELAKFRDANGKPVDLGTIGELPTGTAPTVYLSLRPGDAPSFFATNRGTGGDFTLHGTLEASALSPGD